MSEIALQVDGLDHKGWLEVEVVKSIENLAGAFSASFSDKWALSIKPMNLLPGKKVKVQIDGTTVIDGYIDIVELGLGPERHEIRVQGRDKTGDLIDCSVIQGTGEWKNLKLEDLVKRIAQPFGITVKVEVDTGDRIEKFNVEQGMTAFEAIQKVCALRGCLALADKDGNLVITRAGAQRAGTAIVQGENFQEGRASYDFTERFSEYVVKGQQRTKDNVDAKTAATPKGSVTDSNIDRYRPMLIVIDGQSDKKKALTRAKWEAAVRRGKSREYEILINGWKDGSGNLWEVNRNAQLKAPALGVSSEMLISKVSFTVDERGEMTKLTMVPPEAFTPLEGSSSPQDSWMDNLKNFGNLNGT